MAATEVRGLDVLIKIGSQVVGGQRNASLELSAESIDATCKTTGGWSKKLPGIKTWSSSCDGIYFLKAGQDDVVSYTISFEGCGELKDSEE